MDVGANRMSDQRPMSVLVISHHSSMYGAQLRLLDLADRLRACGVTMELAAPSGGLFPAAWQDRGHRYHPVELPLHRGLRRDDGGRPGPADLVREATIVGRSVKTLFALAGRYDVLHSFSLFAHLEVAVTGRLARVPTVVEVVDIVAPGVGQRVLRTAARLAAATIVNSRATGEPLAGRPRVHVIHPGVDLARFHPGPADQALRSALGGVPGQPLVGIVGRVDREKGIGTLVRAMASGRGVLAQARLAVVGGVGLGPESDLVELQREAERLMPGRVTFAGRRADMPQVMRALDVLVNASATEPFGRSVLEAQASGVAVVATRSGGIPEFVENGVTGLLVPPGDIGAMARALDRLLEDDSLRSSIASTARAQAERAWDIQGRVTQLASLYRRVVAGRLGGPAGGKDGRSGQ